jgi:hypothetical protein
VQRLVLGEGFPRVEHRTRDLASLLSETEWGWSKSADDAFVFPQFEAAPKDAPNAYEQSAESHASALVAQGEKHAHPFVFGTEAKARREIRDADRAASTERSAREIAPSVVYDETRRRLGERD